MVGAALAVSAFLGRRLYEMRVEWASMHTRYAVLAVGLAAWAVSTAPSWLAAPTADGRLLGASGSVHLLVLDVLGMLLVGTLYHIVQFVIWVVRYSDRLGFEPVVMIDHLDDYRLAAADGTLWVGGTVCIVASEWVGLPSVVSGVGGVMLALGAAAFSVNMLLVVHDHGPDSLDTVLLESLSPRR